MVLGFPASPVTTRQGINNYLIFATVVFSIIDDSEIGISDDCLVLWNLGYEFLQQAFVFVVRAYCVTTLY